MDVWNGHFGENPCALTVVGTKGLALLESIIEINIFGVRDDGTRSTKQIIDHKASRAHAARPRRGARGRSAVPVGALCC